LLGYTEPVLGLDFGEVTMIDWAEGQHKLKELVKQLYEEMLEGNTFKAVEVCDDIVIEARLTRAKIKSQMGGSP